MPDLPAGVRSLIRMAVEEDLGSGDITSEATLEPDLRGEAYILAREPLVCCGLQVVDLVFEETGSGVSIRWNTSDGKDVAAGEVMAELEGPMRALMAGERTALNFLQRMCGVATFSRSYARKASGRTVVLDSRKTIPGWRWLDKLAVRTGGCSNHRMGLYDGILIKDNHIAACGGIREAITRVKEYGTRGLPIEVEVEDIRGLEEAVDSGAQIVMLDNFGPELVMEAVKVASGQVRLEVSGNLTLETLGPFLDVKGVDFMSVGELTHSARAVDIAMEVRGPSRR